MTDEQHNKYIAWAFIANSGLQMFLGIVFMAMFLLIATLSRPGDEFGGVVFAVMGIFMLLIQAIFAIPGFVAAFAMFKKRPWARVAAIAAGAISAMSVPIGTLSCVYALWFFLGENWKKVYEITPTTDIAEPSSSLPGSRFEPYVQNEHGEVVFRTVDPPDWR